MSEMPETLQIQMESAAPHQIRMRDAASIHVQNLHESVHAEEQFEISRGLHTWILLNH